MATKSIKRPDFQHRSLAFHLRTLWLFTKSDFKTQVAPQFVFAISAAASGSALTTNPSPSLYDIAWRLPKVLIWIWLNLLMADISNQRMSISIKEDALNKPWRPLPMRRLSSYEATRLLHWLVPTVYLVGEYTGGQRASAYFLAFVYMYNDLNGANEHFLIRNLLTACAYSCFSLGASTIAAGHGQFNLLPQAYTWIYILAAVVTTTVHTQDFEDVKGDLMRGRRTVPIAYGDTPARWSVAILVMAWSFICPAFWGNTPIVFALPLLLGTFISANVLLVRTEEGDKRGWKTWCLWMIVLYLLPLISKLDV